MVLSSGAAHEQVDQIAVLVVAVGAHFVRTSLRREHLVAAIAGEGIVVG